MPGTPNNQFFEWLFQLDDEPNHCIKKWCHQNIALKRWFFWLPGLFVRWFIGIPKVLWNNPWDQLGRILSPILLMATRNPVNSPVEVSRLCQFLQILYIPKRWLFPKSSQPAGPGPFFPQPHHWGPTEASSLLAVWIRCGGRGERIPWCKPSWEEQVTWKILHLR